MQRFHLVKVFSDGYKYIEGFYAGTLYEAAKAHSEFYAAKRHPFAVVLRASDGKRYSVADSRSLLAGGAA